jgi:hypothetical protein
MPTTMTALSSASIRHAEFIRITVNGTPYTFCNAATSITVSGITFAGLSALLTVGDVQRDLKATSDDFVFELTGLNPTYIALILSDDIKGSIVEFWRGFLDSNNQIINTPTLQFFKRYQGIVNTVSISEKFNDEIRERIATCTISCASFKQILENRIAGVKTNEQSWQVFYSNDTSMSRTAIIQNQYFDFGKEVKAGSQSAPDSRATQAGEYNQ